MILKVFVLVGFCSLSESKNRFMPNLPIGEYHVVFEKVYNCDSTKNDSLQFNFYFNKKTLSITELKGNVTTFIPFDDTLTLDINVASWGSIGGWKPNSMIYVAKKACSSFKNVGGNAWSSAFKAFNAPNDNCPVPPGTYSTSGIDLKKFEEHNFPKVYFYGKYKMVFKFKNVYNIVVGCVILEFNLVRPWEISI